MIFSHYLYKMAKKRIKRRKTLLEKKKYVKTQAAKMSKKMTWPEREFVKLMEELNIKCEPQKVIRLKIFDFFLPDYNMIVEVDGDYFHGNPELFEERNKMQRRNVANDRYKDMLARGLGYQLIRVWESDLRNNYDQVKERFENLCK